jgi:hypothetical protein
MRPDIEVILSPLTSKNMHKNSISEHYPSLGVATSNFLVESMAGFTLTPAA